MRAAIFGSVSARVEHGDVLGSLILENAQLGRAIFRDRAVAVEMVGREIQPDADRRDESLNGLELKRAHFDGQDVEIAIFARDFAKRLADVAAGDRALAARIQHLREQFGRGRLAVRAGDRDNRHVDGTPAQFQLAHDLDLRARKIRGQRRDRDRCPGSGRRNRRSPHPCSACGPQIDCHAARAQIFDASI